MTRLNEIQDGKLSLTESQILRAIADYLQYAQNQGKLYYTRLNSGSAFVKRGNKFYKIQLCEEGTADFFVLTKLQSDLWIPRIIFVEVKSEKGRASPAQNAFQKLVENQLAEYVVVRSLGDLEGVLGFEKNKT